MGTWIEMSLLIHTILEHPRRSLQWERGLKYQGQVYPASPWHVVPCNGNVD